MINSRNLIYTNILDLTHFGDHIYVNFHLTMVDDGEIFVGSHTMFGPNVTVLPGVTIGDNSVIGVGSVVTKDIPANVVAFGTPCHVVREIGAHDRQFYHQEMQIEPALLKKQKKRTVRNMPSMAVVVVQR